MPTDVFIVDDEPEILDILQEALSASGFRVTAFSSGSAALDGLAVRQPDLVVTDLRMPGVSGMTLLEKLRRRSPDTQVVILTGYGDMKSAVDALRLGAFDYLTKPLDAERLAQTLRNGAERRRLLLENRALLQRLQEANRIKTEFINGMSHEVRTPLGHILGFTQILEDTLQGLTDKQTRYLQNIQDGARRLLNLFENILQFSVLRSGEVALSPAPFSLASFLQESQDLICAAASRKEIAIERYPVAPDRTIAVDPTICQKAVSLLLDNAVKFTPPGGRIAIRADVRPEPPPVIAEGAPSAQSHARAWLHISVADTGPGVPEQDRDRIFDLFEQGDASLTRHHEGTGLGLALARSLARLHGGAITLDSRPGNGSTFTLVVPLEEP